jgi:hypothetical protein
MALKQLTELYRWQLDRPSLAGDCLKTLLTIKTE